MRVIAVMLLCAGCALHTFAVPQPIFRTREPQTAFDRAVGSVEARCGGTKFVNPDAHVVVGKWQAWNTGDGLYLTQCLVTMIPEDETFTNVRVTFAVRRCPLSDMSDLDAIEPTCERFETVPQAASTELEVIARQVQQDVVR